MPAVIIVLNCNRQGLFLAIMNGTSECTPASASNRNTYHPYMCPLAAAMHALTL